MATLSVAVGRSAPLCLLSPQGRLVTEATGWWLEEGQNGGPLYRKLGQGSRVSGEQQRGRRIRWEAMA